jgi:hypothetical protein
MSRYYLDLRDGDELFPDEEGLDLEDLRAVQAEAALADMARDAIRTSEKNGHYMAIEVRNDFGPVMEAVFSFEIAKTKQ